MLLEFRYCSAVAIEKDWCTNMTILNILVVFSVTLIATSTQRRVILPAVVPGGTRGICPSNGELQSALNAIRNSVQEKVRPTVLCGPGSWRQLIYLNMSRPSQTCPRGWNSVTSPFRACTGVHRTCSSAFFSPEGKAYSRVCGQITGIGNGLPDAFYRHSSGNRGNIEQNYLDGVSITYGQAGSRKHIWSLSMGHPGRCPCDTPDSRFQAPLPPAIGRNNYYCSRVRNRENTYLWQGSGCSAGNPCCSYNDPPVFQRNLTGTTTENVELRICNDELSNDEHLYLLSIEVYIQ